MYTTPSRLLLASTAAALLALAYPATVVGQTVDWSAVDRAMGRSGTAQPGGVRRYGMPRTDLEVTNRGVALAPAFALGSWVAFISTASETIAMGDLVLLESEVPVVMSRLQEGGVQQTALHNHLLQESPHVMYMHIHARGSAVEIAATVRNALATTGTPAASAPAAQPTSVDLDTARIASILGRAGSVGGGVYQVRVPRAETIHVDGIPMPPTMGLATAINFQPTGSGNAAITGDFVMIASEVNPVLEALRRGGIEVEAVHNHLLNDDPRLFFAHFWANKDAVQLSRGLRAALDRMHNAPTTQTQQ